MADTSPYKSALSLGFLRGCQIITCLFVLCTTILSAGEFSFDDEGSAAVKEKDPVSFELFSEESSIQPGRPFWIALHMNIDDHWHAYWKHPGDIGMPTRVEWVLPEGYEISDLEWPYPKKFTQNGFVGFGFENEITLLAKVTPPADAREKNATIEANIRWLVCSDLSCLPGETATLLELPITAEIPKPQEKQADFFKEARAHLPKTMWHTVAKLHDGFIDLQIETPSAIKLTSAYFCPAAKDMVDSKADKELTAMPGYSGRYRLVLKADQKNTPAILEGVLVVEANGQQQALKINLPLIGESNNISMADREKGLILRAPGFEETPYHLEPEPLEFDGGIGLALLFAFIGGLILNLMPCVLPVVSFKVLSFVKMAGQSRSLILKHGLAFSAGVLVSFWVLAGLMLALQSYGQSVGWGFQLQEPLFVAVLAALLMLFGLSLFGVFEMGTSVTAMAGKLNAQRSSSALAGSFLSGILATAVATPCTGPFLGSAIGFAVTLPTIWALLIFTSLGMGMASPYLLLAAFPNLLRFIPKPGPWMDTFKEILGFVMMATVLWLVWVFAAQTSSLSIFMLLLSFFILAVGAWVFGRWGTVAHKKNTRLLSVTAAILCLCAAGYAIILSVSPLAMEAQGQTAHNSKDGWEVFSPERVEELQAAGVPVLIDFTAKWCLICQANHLVLSVDQVESKIAEKGVVKMKADWTKNDPVITNALKKFGRNGVPLYVLYAGDPTAQPVVLPQVLTPDIVVSHLNELDGPIALK